MGFSLIISFLKAVKGICLDLLLETSAFLSFPVEVVLRNCRYLRRLSQPATHPACALFSNQKTQRKLTVVEMRERNQVKPKSSAQSYVRGSFHSDGILSK